MQGNAPAIMYKSTNGSPEIVDFKKALFKGQASDRGLFMPTEIPVIPQEVISSMKDMAYPEIASIVLSYFLGGEIPQKELGALAKDAYNFDVPMQTVSNDESILWLTRGPTLSFKDLAARMMSRIMQYYLRKDAEEKKVHRSPEDDVTIWEDDFGKITMPAWKDSSGKITVLLSTSGDTGSAVAHALYGLSNIDCIVLFPENEVTELQRKQMTTLGKNVTTYAVKGTFDDCQALVKRAFADPELEYLNLTSANSINFGRLLPQIIQYFYAYSRSAKGEEDEPVISVPCGNFGHLTAGIIAKRMGLPIHKFVAATNANDEFPEFLKRGIYEPLVPSKNCISNAMNVGHPSNLARIVALYGGQMDEKGKIVKMPDLEAMGKDIFSVSISDEETMRAMRGMYDKYGIILDPHGAVGWAGLKEYLKQAVGARPCVLFETADPGKFLKPIKDTLGIDLEVPKVLAELMHKKENYKVIPNEYEELKKALMASLKN